jgi:hypothetical protein
VSVGITGVAGGTAVLTTGSAVGVADPQADATSISTKRAENMILFFIIILLERVLRHSCASRINIDIYYPISINNTLNIILIPG